MKKLFIIWFIGLMALLNPMGVKGQTETDCPWFKNPMVFGNTGTPSSNTFRGWSARVGQRISSGASSGTVVYSTCAASNCQNIIGHNNITSNQYNTGADAGITCCNHGSLWDAAQDHRFMIITSANAGIDQLTINGNNGMQRIPPGYTSSIRLGDPRASYDGAARGTLWNSSNANKSSEALFYTLNVNPNNALLFINYAVVGRCYDHEAPVAGEFLLRVVKQDDDGTWPNAPINDSLWFRISAPPIPSSGIPNAPWMMGRPGTSCASTTCAYVYKPWTKVAINLSKYLYKKVRIEMYTSDCVPTVDPIYAYICGDFQPMRINSAGCADARSDVIDTLSAPEGLSQYTWYVTTMGAEEHIYNESYMEGVSFRRLTQPSNSNIYTPTTEDFILTQGPHAGDTVSTQTFMCTMVSALDPDKPFTSKVYTNLENTKPIPRLDLSTECDLTVHLTDQSFTYSTDQIDPDSTRWIIYDDTTGTHVIDTLWGPHIDYQLPQEGYYRVSMRSKIAEKQCSSVKDMTFRILQTHEIPILLDDSIVCDDEIATAWTIGGEGLTKEWRLDDSTMYRSDSIYSYDTVSFAPPTGTHVVTLTTTTDGQCPATSSATFKVIGNINITSDTDVSLICRGDSVTIKALGLDHPRWSSIPYDSSLVGSDDQSIVTVAPQVTTTYTVQPLVQNRCVQDAADITIDVIPYPIPTIFTNSHALELTNPSIHLEDRSPNSTSSRWTFSDGLTEEGARINHLFVAASDSVWIALHTCNKNLCCADTSISLPVQVNAIWIPNTFTPGYKTNKRFTFYTTLEITYYEIWIYNRQGLLVFHGDDINMSWNGTDINGNPCPQGTYVYHYVYTSTQNPKCPLSGTGTVTLLR